MEEPKKKSYIFLDESGKPEVYSRKGINLVTAGAASKFLVIAAVKVDEHLTVQEAVTAERLRMLQDTSLAQQFSPAYSLNAFHAQTDYPAVRQRFYEWIRDCKLDLKISVIVADKLKAFPHLQYDPGGLYATVAGQLLKRVLHTADHMEVIFSRRDSSLRTRERLQLIVDTFTYRIFLTKNPTLGAIHSSYPLREVRTSHVLLDGLPGM